MHAFLWVGIVMFSLSGLRTLSVIKDDNLNVLAIVVDIAIVAWAIYLLTV